MQSTGSNRSMMHITRQCHTVKRKSARSDYCLSVETLLSRLLNVNGRPGLIFDEGCRQLVDRQVSWCLLRSSSCSRINLHRQLMTNRGCRSENLRIQTRLSMRCLGFLKIVPKFHKILWPAWVYWSSSEAVNLKTLSLSLEHLPRPSDTMNVKSTGVFWHGSG